MTPGLDVLVVGAGASGWLCAGMLAQCGARVELLADNASAPPASAVAAGMLAPLSEALQAPAGGHPAALALGLESAALWSDLAAQIDIDLRRSGTQLLLGPETRIAALRTARAAGVAAHPGEEGVFLADEAVLEPRAALKALRRWAQGLGVAVSDGAKVVEILSQPGCVVGVRLADHAIRCGQAVVLAPGAWANAAMRRAAPALDRLTPARGCLVEFQTETDSAGPMIRAEGVYLVPQSGGRLLAGASMEFGVASPVPDAGQLALLRERAIAVRPDLQHAPWSGRAGVRAMSPDWSPLIGRTPVEGLFLAAGMGRNGWLLAPVTGRMLCDYVSGQAPAPLHAGFSPDRFGPP